MGEGEGEGGNGIRVGSNPLLEISPKNIEPAASSNLELEISHDAELLPGDAMPVDELLVHKGDMVDVYEFYDDGWALVVGPTGAAGMVPQAYLDRSIATPLTPLDSPIL